MPKMKTKRAAAKRFKTTGTGKLMKMKANMGAFFVLPVKCKKLSLSGELASHSDN